MNGFVKNRINYLIWYLKSIHVFMSNNWCFHSKSSNGKGYLQQIKLKTKY